MIHDTRILNEAIATVATQRVKSLFGSDKTGMARLRGFTAGEISQAVQLLSEWASDAVQLVVISDEPVEGLPPRYMLEEGKSATTYRNELGSCVFFELSRFSDQQGLKNVTLLNDGNLLREGAETDQDGTSGRVNVAAWINALRTVWKLKKNGGHEPPQAIVRSTGELVEVLNDHRRQLALREWIRFCEQLCDQVPVGVPVDGRVAREAVGLSLPALKLFPDPDLAEIAGDVPRRRRLSENVWAGEDRTKAGRELDRDELATLVDQIEFRDIGGEPLAAEALRTLRLRIREYLQAHERASTVGIDFRYWKQLFESTSRRRGLGTRVQEEIEDTAQNRLGELAELDVVDELDAKEPAAAQRFLDAEPDDEDEVALADLLSARLRKAVERVANPTAKATDQPLRHLLRLIDALVEEEEGATSQLFLEVRQSHGTDSQDQLSKALFAFLYGRTLRDCAERTQGTFAVAEELTDPGALELWMREENEEESDSDTPIDDQWSALRLQLRWEDEKTGAEFFEWRPKDNPGFAAFAKAIYQPDVWRWHTPNLEFDEWCAKALDPGPLLGPQESATGHGLVEEWLTQRSSVFQSLAKNGLSAGALEDYVEIWGTLLERAYSSHVPQGTSDPAVEEFLQVEIHRGPDGSPTMLATHPLRLRWIAANLSTLSDLLVDARGGALRLNEINEGFFFDRTGQASPHEQPPVLCDDSHIYVAVREADWHERYEVVRTRDRTLTDWLADLDDSSLDEMAGALSQYVDAYPYKADGLHLLVVAREGGARMVREIVGRFLARSGLTGGRSEMQLFLHVVCPRKEFSPVADAIGEFDDGSGKTERDFPRFHVVLHEWASDNPTPASDGLPSGIDIAVVPNLFSASTRCQESTRPVSRFQGNFDPWLDRPTMRESAGTGIGAKNVSRILVPEQRDDLLLQWSTVNVRHFRGAEVGTGDGSTGDVDVVMLNVSVSDGESFFQQLHDRAHWVVTLDAFVGRRQIEALEHRPEVITVKPGLGKGGAYTLVVSSQAGREFVIHRLTRRLAQQLGSDLDMDPGEVASQIYDRARELAPGTLLRAIGLGRTAQELVGLVVSQRLVRQFYPADIGRDGFESWIALDERPDWFGGNKNLRADLLRVVGSIRDDRVHLSLTVVEAKLRDKGAIRKAETQLDSTVDLLSEALIPTVEDPPHDAAFWRRTFLQAIKSSARELTDGGGSTFRAVSGGRAVDALDGRWADAIRSGDYVLEPPVGVACTVSEGASGAHTATPNGRHSWISASREEVARVLHDVGEGIQSGDLEPHPRDTATEVPARDEEVDGRTAAPEGQLPNEPDSGPAESRSDSRGLSDEELTRRYQRVLDTFAEYGVEVSRDEARPTEEGPGFFVFRVRPGSGVQPAKLIAQLDNLKYSLELPAELQPRAYIDRGAVVFEVPKAEDERYYVAADDIWTRSEWPNDRLWVAIGEDVAGNVVSIDFSTSDTPHLLVGGITGAGKSVAIETLLTGLTRHYDPDSLKISAVDPKRTELSFLEDLPHLKTPLGFDSEDALNILNRAVEEMEARYELMRQHRVRSLRELNRELPPDRRQPWHLIILDEFADLTSDRDSKKGIEALLQRLTQKARAAGLHVIVATQKPSADVISTTVRSNLGAQLALRVKTATDSRIIMDEMGAESLAGNGDAILKTSGAAMVRLQCAIV